MSKTLQAWRITKLKNIDTAFSGDGARCFPGRWNSRGISMVYCASSASLAMLELLVHLEFEALLQHHYGLITVDIPTEAAMALADAELPNDWNGHPPPDSTRALGDAWSKANTSLVLAVPSAIMAIDVNYLINPHHPDFHTLVIGALQPIGIDERLMK